MKKTVLLLCIVITIMFLIIPASALNHSIQFQNHCSYDIWVTIQGGQQYVNPVNQKTYGACQCMYNGDPKPDDSNLLGCSPSTICENVACGTQRQDKCDKGDPLVDGGGFKVGANGGTHTTTVSRNWQGAFWGRTGCTGTDDDLNCDWMTTPGFDGKGKLKSGGGGLSSATKGEINFDEGGHDTYDTSYVDGYNVPMAIEVVPGTGKKLGTLEDERFDCTLAGGKTDFIPLFEKSGLNISLKKLTAAGTFTGIKSACTLASDWNLARNGKMDAMDQLTNMTCCIPPWSSKQNAPVYNGVMCNVTYWPQDLQTAQFFRQHEFGAYSYAYDDAASTFQCKNFDDNSQLTSYIVTFCGEQETTRTTLPGQTEHVHVSEVGDPRPVTPEPTATPVPAQTPVPSRYNPASSGSDRI